MAITVTHHVDYYETDAMAVVHHSTYIRWFEIGRVAYLRAAGIDLNELTAAGYSYPITAVNAKYVSPARFDDNVLIETTAKAMTRAKMEFTYTIRMADTGVVLVTGFSQNVFTSLATGHVTRLPEKYYAPLAKAMAQEKAAKSAKEEEH